MKFNDISLESNIKLTNTRSRVHDTVLMSNMKFIDTVNIIQGFLLKIFEQVKFEF